MMQLYIRLFYILILARSAFAQVEMRHPPPRRSKFSQFYISSDNVDYNMKSPLGGQYTYPCRNFPAGPIQGELVAGDKTHIFFDGSAARQGGDCQFAISYDNGTTFAVIWDKLENCFLDTINGGYEITLPETLPPANNAILAWTWINGVGKREYYMNCADVRVRNYSDQQEPYTGKKLLVVNVPGYLPLGSKKEGIKDPLVGMLDRRPYVTVGRPTSEKHLKVEEVNRDDSAEKDSNNDGDNDAESKKDAAEEEEKPEGNADGGGSDDDDDSSKNDDNNDSDSDDTATGTVVLYLSESTMTETRVSYVTEYITTDKDPNSYDLYSLGPHETRGAPQSPSFPGKPLFGTNIGLTIISEPDDINLYTGDTELYPALAKPSSESVEMLKPPNVSSLADSFEPIIMTTPEAIFPISSLRKHVPRMPSSIDLMTPGVQNSKQKEYPLFDTPVDLDSNAMPVLEPLSSDFQLGGHDDFDPLSGLDTPRTLRRSRLPYSPNAVHTFHNPQMSHLITMYETITINRKPVLKVVVSATDTIPTSPSLYNPQTSSDFPTWPASTSTK